MKETFGVIEKIALSPSTNDKKALIKKYDSPMLRKVASYALGQDRVFNLTELPPYNKEYEDDIFDYLDYLNNKGGCTNAEAQILADIVGPDPEIRELVTRILNKDLRCGAGAKLFNEVIPGCVFRVPYQRYSSFSAIDKIDFENDTVIAQIKMDGMFAYLMPDGSFMSRNGSKFSLNGAIVRDEEWAQKAGEDNVWMGELLISDGEKFLPRKTGNGIINKFISGTGDANYADNIRYVTWGYVTLSEFLKGSSDRTYLEMLNSIQADSNGKILFSQSTKVTSKEEALAFYSKCRQRKEEGAIVKVANKLKWKDESSGSKFGAKLKPEALMELEIVEAYYGKKGHKYENYLGGLVVKSSCGKIFTKLGGGFSDVDRVLGVDWWNEKKGKIVTAAFTGLTTDKSSRETFCFDHGRFVETRFNEKDEADTYEYAVEQLKNV